jgi:hypothetical protein
MMMTNMNTTATTSKPKTHNNTQKNRLPIAVVLLTVVLISSSLITVGISFITNPTPSTDGNIVHVTNEKELTNTINKAKNPTTIKLNNDITLTNTLNIPNKKTITLTSNTTTEEYFKLTGAKDQTTININNKGVLHLADITVTHEKDTDGLGINVTKGGKLYMTSGKISGNNGDGGVAVYTGGFFEMTGGTIADNSGWRFGGGVWVDGSFNMTGNAIIANNTAGRNGWGVFVAYNGVFNMAGNSMITNNNIGHWISCSGCGVFNNGVFEMTGNSIMRVSRIGRYVGVMVFTRSQNVENHDKVWVMPLERGAKIGKKHEKILSSL